MKKLTGQSSMKVKFVFVCLILILVRDKCCASKPLFPALFDSVQKVSQHLPNKINLVYSFVTWCEGEPASILEIREILSKNREKYNLICIVDTAQGIYHKYFDDLNPDAIIKFNTFYPNCLRSRNEQKYALEEYNRVFGLDDEYYGGGGGLFIVDHNGAFITRVYLNNRVAHLQLFIDHLMP